MRAASTRLEGTMHEEFAKGLIYDRMSRGGIYFTAKQMQQMAEGIAILLDNHDQEDLKVLHGNLDILWDAEATVEEPAISLLAGYLYACEQFVGIQLTDNGQLDTTDYAELAVRFYRMSGVVS